MVKVIGAGVVMLGVVVFASAADITGTWNLQAEGPELKTINSVVLDLKVDGSGITGTAHIGSWPGDAPISNGKLSGDHISFEATGHATSSTGIPTCRFEGTVVGDEMLLTMTMIKNPANRGAFKFKGRKQSPSQENQPR